MAAIGVMASAPALAGGRSGSGEPFPEKVAGVRLGMTKQQVVDGCAKAGGRAGDPTVKRHADATFCSRPLEQISSLPDPSGLRVDFCGQAACEVKLFYDSATVTTVEWLLQRLSLKYGAERPNEGALSVEDLARVCRSDKQNQQDHTTTWIFTDTKDGARILGGRVALYVTCSEDVGLYATVIYENAVALGINMARAKANF